MAKTIDSIQSSREWSLISLYVFGCPRSLLRLPDQKRTFGAWPSRTLGRRRRWPWRTPTNRTYNEHGARGRQCFSPLSRHADRRNFSQILSEVLEKASRVVRRYRAMLSSIPCTLPGPYGSVGSRRLNADASSPRTTRQLLHFSSGGIILLPGYRSPLDSIVSVS